MNPQQNKAKKPSPSTEVRTLKKGKIKFLSVLVAFFGLVLPSMVSAAKVTLNWDANNPTPEGYRVYMRTEGQTYDYNTPAWSGTATTCTIDQLADNTYYFVARAFQDADESGDSNEVEYQVVINQPPQADAGSDQAVSANTQVTLDGSASADPDGIIATYKWTQTTGTTVTLANATSAKPTFTAPNVTSTSTLDFELTVSDTDGLTASDTCQVTVLPVEPTDSDNDGLSDTDETDLYGTNPYNADTDGDGISDGQEVSDGTDPTNPDPQYAKIWIEAEDGDIYAPMEIADNAEASEGSYIWVPYGAGSNGYAEYTFEFQTTGDYLIWGRVISNDNASNSFYVSVDGGSDITWHTKQGGQETWTWDVVKDASNPLVVHFEAGMHSLTIKQRENGTKIDRILITNDMDYVPEGMGEQSAPTFQKLWIETENGTVYAPMQIDTDTKASNDGYIWVPIGAGSGGYAQYTFDIQEAGDYVIWGRVISNDNASNSFYVSVDGGSDITWHTKQGGQETWTWDVVKDASNPLVVHFEAGVHTITLKQRENGTKIDRFLVTDDISYVPEN
jgi:hypothetical protein